MRIDCPFCKNINTLSVDTTENNIKWYCFHSTCSAKGKYQGEKNMQYVEKVLKVYTLMKKLCDGYLNITVGKHGLGVEQI